MVAKRYVMIGAPVTNVRTPDLLEARFAAAGQEAQVKAVHLESPDLASFMNAMRDDASIDGLMVTMPHKRTIVPFLDCISDTAAAIGSVNAVKRMEGGVLAGAQFDGAALLRALIAAEHDPRDARVLLLGFGGAGRAIARALIGHGCACLAIYDPALDEHQVAADIAGLSKGLRESTGGEPWDGAGTFDILINATPLGMKKGDPSPFTAEQVSAASCVADIVADPAVTHLSEMTRERNKRLVSGRDMVAAQIDPIFDWLQSGDAEQ